MPAATATTRRAWHRQLRSPLAIPGSRPPLPDAGPAGETGSGLPAAPPAPRTLTLADFRDYLRTTTNRDGRPYEAGTINADLSPAKTLGTWMSANGIDGDFTAADTALLPARLPAVRPPHNRIDVEQVNHRAIGPVSRPPLCPPRPQSSPAA